MSDAAEGMTRPPAKDSQPPRFEVKHIGDGFVSIHAWPGDGTHFSDGIVVEDDHVFSYGVLATNEEVRVIRGRLVVICLDPGDDEEASYDLDLGDAVKLIKGRSYRFVAVGFTQYHCEHGPEKAKVETAADQPALSASSAAASPSRPPAPGLPSRPRAPLGSGSGAGSSADSGTRATSGEGDLPL